MTERLTSKQRKAVSQIAGLTILNAMVFQEVLSRQETRVKPLHALARDEDVAAALARQWQLILTEIDFVPIFSVARELVLALPAEAQIEDALRTAAASARVIVANRAALRHDLMGRVYHRLLADAKYLGTYYTSIPAATLLLRLALERGRWGTDWTDVDSVADIRIGDLACGTGTLLMAAADAVKDNHVRAAVEAGESVDVGELHKTLMEDVLYGCDVLPSALHLTASTLALLSTDVTFELTNLFSLPLGGEHGRLGSIELLTGEVAIVQDMFGAVADAGQVAGEGHLQERVAAVPMLDLCVMNPPFTRSVGGNLLFGSLPPKERKKAQRRLADLLRNKHKPVLANSTAGLGSVFAAVGDRYVKRGGRLALVLPKALLSGVAWSKTRVLLGSDYQVEDILVSHDPDRWNFSDNTDLSEVLVIARKRTDADLPLAEDRVRCTNLWWNPTNSFQALALAEQLLDSDSPDAVDQQGACNLVLGGMKVGESISVQQEMLGVSSWMLPCAFAQADLVRVALHLREGKLFLPGSGICAELPIRPLGSTSDLGPDRRDVWDGFSRSEAATPFPAVLGHSSSRHLSIALEPDSFLTPLPAPKNNRPLRRVEDLWPKAARILIAERLRINTARLLAARCSEAVLSNVWWPYRPSTNASPEAEKALILWLNSTLSIVQMLAVRAETEGAWIELRKPVIAGLPVMAVEQLTSAQLAQLSNLFDEISNDELLPLPLMAEDPVRTRIDVGLAEALRIPDISRIRSMLSREPVVCLKPLGGPAASGSG